MTKEKVIKQIKSIDNRLKKAYTSIDNLGDKRYTKDGMRRTAKYQGLIDKSLKLQEKKNKLLRKERFV
jgi:hypothetical protein